MAQLKMINWKWRKSYKLAIGIWVYRERGEKS